MKKILLVGNPNVGKSVIFSRLTGVNVIASNYSGTTVSYTKGYMHIGDEKFEIIDIPGLYSFQTDSKAEQVAVEMIQHFQKEPQDNIFINVIDSTNFERNLHLTLQLIKMGLPMIICMNFWDETKHTGIHIDLKKLGSIIGIPVVATTGVTGEGIKELISHIPEATPSNLTFQDEYIWKKVGDIIDQTQKLSHRHHTFLERLGDISVRPVTGIPIAIFILLFSFFLIRFISESIIAYIMDPIFENLWEPFLLKFTPLIDKIPYLSNILIGKLINNQIDFVQSLGLLTTGLYVPVAMVFPYILSFYFFLSFLEDSGYLPRLGVLVDNLMHKLGIHGLAIIPMLLGIGCNVPGAMAARVLETRRERFIASTLMAIAVPCMADIAMIFGMVGRYGAVSVATVFATLFVVWVLLGLILNASVKGESPEIFVEIPPYRIPYWYSLFKKVWIRIILFFKEAIPFVLLGVLIVNIFYTLHIIDFVGAVLSPLISGILGLPESAVGALIIGFLRKDVAVGMLVPLGLTHKQMIIAAVVLTMYFPCIATFSVLIRELGIRDMFYSAMIMLFSTFIVGGILNLVL